MTYLYLKTHKKKYYAVNSGTGWVNSSRTSERVSRYGRIHKEEKPLREARDLTVFFNWNGYSWEAHEVLGVPAGSPLTELDRVIEKILEEKEKGEQEIYKAAYRAIVAQRTGL